MKTDLFQSCGHSEFSKFAGIFSAALSQHHLSGVEIAPLEFHRLHLQGGVRRGVRASGSYQEGTGKSGCFAMWKHPRGHVWNVVVTRPHPEVRPEGREPLPDKAGESTVV